MDQHVHAAAAEAAHLPLFVLREHGGSLLSSAFYPFAKWDMPTRSHLFLSGDVDGEAILWDLEVRKPLVSFHATDTALASTAAAEEARCTDSGDGALQQRQLLALARAMHENAARGPVGILGVGFLHVGPVARQGSGEVPASAAAVAPTGSSSPAERQLPDAGGRPRFRLPRPARALAGEEAVGGRGGDAAVGASGGVSGAACGGHRPQRDHVYFYTHCRNQRLHVWAYDLGCAGHHADSSSSGAVRLLYSLHVPHTGFCPAVSALVFRDGPPARRCDSVSSTLVLIPGDGNSGGVATAWAFSHRRGPDQADASADAAVGGGGDDDNADYGGIDSKREEARLPDTTGMDPMDALIASAAAVCTEERRTATATAAKGLRPLFEAAADDHRDGGAWLAVDFAGAVPTLPSGFTVKSGVVMGMSVTAAGPAACSKGLVLCSAFESGHVTLCGLDWAPPRVQARVLAAVRAFPEAAMTCLLARRGGAAGEEAGEEAEEQDGDCVIATSAEGSVQCFRLAPCRPTPQQQRQQSLPLPLELSLQPCWSAALPKGIGSACAAGRLLVLGCWDGSLRLYDLPGRRRRPGASTDAAAAAALVSVLPLHTPEAVNSVSAAPSQAVAAQARFAFDPRRHRPHADAHGGGGVHVFASASKDGRVAVWRVDFAALRHSGELQGGGRLPAYLPPPPVAAAAAAAVAAVSGTSAVAPL